MAPGPDADALYLDRILELIQLVQNGILNWTRATFLADRDKIDVTAYRLSVIGEISRKLSADLKLRRSEIAWSNIYAMRNIVVHHYERVNPSKVWDIATTSLEALAVVCRQELDRLGG